MARRTSKRVTRRGRPPWQRLIALPAGISAAALIGYLLLTTAPGLSIPGLEDTATSSRWATVETDVLNIRAAPTTGSAILGSHVQGEEIEVVGDAEAGFVPVRHGGDRGWMAVEYLAFEGATQPMSRRVLQAPEVLAAEWEEPSVPQADAPESVAVDRVAVSVVPGDEPEVVTEPAERWIDVDRSTATVTLYEGDTAIASFIGKIGRDPSADGFYSTAIGTFHVYSMNKGLAPTPFADDTYLSDWVGFDPERKNGIHSPVRDQFGNEKAWQNPSTLGCVRLTADAAITVFDFAEIGMRVEVHD